MIKKQLEKIPNYIKFLLKTYLLGMIFFTVFRIINTINFAYQIDNIESGQRTDVMLKAFWMGLRFDTVVSGYILLLPFFILAIFSFVQRRFKSVDYLVYYLTGTIYILAFSVCSADIPFFDHYFARLNVAVFQWNENLGWIAQMIFQEWTFLLFGLGFIGFSLLFFYLYKKVFNSTLKMSSDNKDKNYAKFLTLRLTYFLIFIAALYVAIRGRIEERQPIGMKTAFFSAYAFPNQLGLNPIYTFIRSYINTKIEDDRELSLIDDEEALEFVKKEFGINDSVKCDSPIARGVDFEGNSQKPNIVIVMMESMSVNQMGWFGNEKNLTPYLDSLSEKSLTFDNIYTSGIHTYNGIFSTLFAYPAIYIDHPMKGDDLPNYSGFSYTLGEVGYTTMYFTTHDDKFDNTGNFLRNNGFDKVISEKDYPEEEIVSTLGVPDHVMFEESISYLNNEAKNSKPFFAAIMTTSNHVPYYIPENIPFEAKNSNIKDAVVEYSDWAIKHFMALAKEQSWFNNTLFVFLADHGAVIDPIYDMPLSLHHSPLIIHAPELIGEHKVISKVGGQLDVFPTIMGLIKQPYVNNTLGIDLLNDSRKYIYFSDDDDFGVLNEKYYYIERQIGKNSLYRYRESDVTNFALELDSVASNMQKYGRSMFQVSEYLKKNKLTGMQK